MTTDQYEILKRNKWVLDLYHDTQTINTAHPAIGELNNLHKDLMGQHFNTSCGDCVVHALEGLYRDFNEQITL